MVHVHRGVRFVVINGFELGLPLKVGRKACGSLGSGVGDLTKFCPERARMLTEEVKILGCSSAHFRKFTGRKVRKRNGSSKRKKIYKHKTQIIGLTNGADVWGDFTIALQNVRSIL